MQPKHYLTEEQIVVSTENKYVDKPIKGYEEVHEGE
jgi:hypothetical protein